jgi:ketosteroid isomerase-like protein
MEIEVAIAAFEAANRRFLSGDPEPYLALCLQSPDDVLMSALGGCELGWPAVRAHYEAASRRFTDGDASYEWQRVIVSGDIAVTVSIEHGRRRMDGGEVAASDLRCTQVWRRTPEGWKIQHRQADRLVERLF